MGHVAEHGGEHGAHGRLARQGQGAQCGAVVGAPTGDDQVARGFAAGHLELAGELDCRLDRLGAARQVVEAGIGQWHPGGQPLAVGFQGGGGEPLAVDVGHLRRLGGHGLGDDRTPWPMLITRRPPEASR